MHPCMPEGSVSKTKSSLPFAVASQNCHAYPFFLFLFKNMSLYPFLFSKPPKPTKSKTKNNQSEGWIRNPRTEMEIRKGKKVKGPSQHMVQGKVCLGSGKARKIQMSGCSHRACVLRSPVSTKKAVGKRLSAQCP